jgi:hypothetical protein
MKEEKEWGRGGWRNSAITTWVMFDVYAFIELLLFLWGDNCI